MKKLSTTLITIIAMVSIMVGAAAIYEVMVVYRDAKFEKERQERYEEVTAATEVYFEEIQDIAKLSTEEITEYIEEKAYVEEIEVIEDAVDPWEESVISETDPLITQDETTVSQNDIDGWESGTSEENVNRVAELGADAVSKMDEEVSDMATNDDSDEKSADDANKTTDENVDDEILSEDDRVTLAQRQQFRTSYEETELWIEADEIILEENKEDFSKIKIACIGDSITEAANLLEVEDYEQYTYPTRLKEILDCAEVYNFGIGGSSLGRFWYEPFCERYDEIPEDVDIILIMGGTNDGYCMSEDMVGNIDEREYRTLYGDVNDLMKGLKEDYPDAEVIFITPMPNLLHDVLRKERENLLSQTVVVDCIIELAEEYDYEVIDLYNSNFFDSHDADIVSKYIPDSVHPNEEGYEILAQHLAAEIIRIHEQKDTENEIEELENESIIDEDDPEGKLLEEYADEDEESLEEEKTESKTIIYSRNDDSEDDEDSEDMDDSEDERQDEAFDDKKDAANSSEDKDVKKDSKEEKTNKEEKNKDSREKDSEITETDTESDNKEGSKTEIYERD